MQHSQDLALPGQLRGGGTSQPVGPLELRGIALVILVGVLLMVQVLDGMDMNALSFVGRKVIDEFHISRAQLGGCIGITFLGMSVGAVILGRLGDQLGRRLCIIAIVAAFAGGQLATAFAPNVQTLFILRLLTGLALGGYYPVAASLLVDYSPIGSRGTAVTMLTVGSAVGAAICGVLAAFVVPSFGWRSLFIVGGVLPLLMLPLIFLCVPPGSAQPNKSKSPLWHLPLPSLFRHEGWRTTVSYWLAKLFGAFPVFFLVGWLPTLALSHTGTPAQAALTGALYQIMSPVGGLALAWFSDRLGSRMVVGAALAGALCMVLLGGLQGYAFMAASMATGFFVSGMLIFTAATAAQCYARPIRGFALGCGTGVQRVGAALAPWLGGLLLDKGLALQVILAIGGGAVFLSGLMLLLMAQRPVVGAELE
jgi:AAHS family 4-hydroxybenzoate transporter-like MFS transporter